MRSNPQSEPGPPCHLPAAVAAHGMPPFQSGSEYRILGGFDHPGMGLSPSELRHFWQYDRTDARRAFGQVFRGTITPRS